MKRLSGSNGGGVVDGVLGSTLGRLARRRVQAVALLALVALVALLVLAPAAGAGVGSGATRLQLRVMRS